MFVSRFVPSPHLLNEDDLEDKELQTGKEGDETGVRSLKREMERRSNRVCAIEEWSVLILCLLLINSGNNTGASAYNISADPHNRASTSGEEGTDSGLGNWLSRIMISDSTTAH